MSQPTERDRETARRVMQDIVEHGYEGGVARHFIAQALADAAEAARVEERASIFDVAADIAHTWCLVPPDGGSPTNDEINLCESLAKFLHERASRARGGSHAE